jgi:hypothetical protein
MSQKLGGIPRTNYDDGKFSDPDRYRDNSLVGMQGWWYVEYSTVYIPWSEGQADSSAYRDTSQITTATEIDRNALNA